jgi:hypothetical protein
VLYSAGVLLSLLAQLFDDPQLAIDLKSYRRSAYANTYLALGKLSYGTRKFREARGFLLRAVASNLSFGLKRELMVTLLKSLVLDTKLFDRLKGTRQKIVI